MSKLEDLRFAIVSSALVMDTESIRSCIEGIVGDQPEPEYIIPYKRALEQFNTFANAVETYRQFSYMTRNRAENRTKMSNDELHGRTMDNILNSLGAMVGKLSELQHRISALEKRNES